MTEFALICFLFCFLRFASNVFDFNYLLLLVDFQIQQNIYHFFCFKHILTYFKLIFVCFTLSIVSVLFRFCRALVHIFLSFTVYNLNIRLYFTTILSKYKVRYILCLFFSCLLNEHFLWNFNFSGQLIDFISSSKDKSFHVSTLLQYFL